MGLHIHGQGSLSFNPGLGGSLAGSLQNLIGQLAQGGRGSPRNKALIRITTFVKKTAFTTEPPTKHLYHQETQTVFEDTMDSNHNQWFSQNVLEYILCFTPSKTQNSRHCLTLSAQYSRFLSHYSRVLEHHAETSALLTAGSEDGAQVIRLNRKCFAQSHLTWCFWFFCWGGHVYVPRYSHRSWFRLPSCWCRSSPLSATTYSRQAGLRAPREILALPPIFQ